MKEQAACMQKTPTGLDFWTCRGLVTGAGEGFRTSSGQWKWLLGGVLPDCEEHAFCMCIDSGLCLAEALMRE
jgi:hypothetical protein